MIGRNVKVECEARPCTRCRVGEREFSFWKRLLSIIMVHGRQYMYVINGLVVITVLVNECLGLGWK
jgi:hypothetical protein